MKLPSLRRIGRHTTAVVALVYASMPALATGRGAHDPSRSIDYRAREVHIPMRDGVELYTQIFEPIDAPEPCPILLQRTPYGIGSVADDPASVGPSPGFARAGYVLVRQDVRGQFRSGGEWALMRPVRRDVDDPEATDEVTDTHDTIEWLLENVERHNGRVGMWGISYDAWQTTLAMTDAHPALVACSPQASPGNEFVGDDMHHNGAFRLSYTFAWIAYMAARRGDADPSKIGPALSAEGYELFRAFASLDELAQEYFPGGVDDWDQVMEHGDYDAYWRERNVLSLLDDVRPAVLNVVGWFDAEDFRGPLDIYRAIERHDDERRNFLVVGPWEHGGWNTRTGRDGSSLGDLAFDEPTGEWYAEVVELPFFEHHLRDAADPALPEAYAFETGANRWHELDRWPPRGVRPRALHLRANGVASFDPPGADEGATRLESDPEVPVPYSAEEPVFPGPEYMVEDQRFLAGREDVLSFVTPPLEEDLVIAGPVDVRLRFTTTGTDADWIVKLIDVWPDDTEAVSAATGASMAGAQVLLTGDVFRAKYRDSFESPSALVPGELTELSFALPERFHRFLAGHRLMVQLHATWFPLYDRNPQVFTDVYTASVDDFVPAAMHVWHREGAASHLILPVLEE